MLDFEASQQLLGALEVPRRTERLALAAAAGRVLAADVAIDRDQPGFDRATMDGYAVARDGDGTRFRVRGTIAAGTTFEGELAPGDAVRIMTGAPVPPALTVVPIERTDALGKDGEPDEVEVTEPEALEGGRRNVAFRGEDARANDVVLASGTRLGPVHLSAAAMAGARELEVFASPRCAVVTTGDEVGGAGPAGIRDSNGPLLSALLGALGVELQREHARDDASALRDALARAADSADVVVTTGGVSMGDRDFVPATIAELGFEQVFHKVAIQPGKPVLLARRADGTLFLGLPGNPVSVLATAHLFLVPALGLFAGDARPDGRWLELPMSEAYTHRGRRHLFLPAVIEGGGVRAIRWNGSGDLLAASAGDGLVDLPVGSDLAPGDRVRFLPYVGHQIGVRGVLPPREPR